MPHAADRANDPGIQSGGRYNGHQRARQRCRDKVSEFTLQVSKTFWNAFQNSDQSWVGVVVGVPTSNINFLVVFPEDKPYITFDHYVNDENKNRIKMPDQTYVIEGPQNRWVWWSIENPKLGHGYHIDWEW